MIDDSDIRICAGGKEKGYKGIMPGVLEEIIIAIELNKPLYLLGGFGGITRKVCDYIEKGVVKEELSTRWQIDNNPYYEELLDLHSNRNDGVTLKYELLLEKVGMDSLKNGLSSEENIKLFNTPFAEEALQLIFKGINKLEKI